MRYLIPIQNNTFSLAHKLCTQVCFRRRINTMTTGLNVELLDNEKKLFDLLRSFASYRDEEIHSAGSQALVLRVTGGWVRDKLLGKTSTDIDIGINSMTGDAFANELRKYVHQRQHDNPKVAPIHKVLANPDKSKHLETATTSILGIDIDFVNLRSETYSQGSRVPIMEFGTPQEDALRRDATINALFYNIMTRQVEDFTGKGLQDLKQGILRTPLPPLQTFDDDPLRVLRLVRFSSRFNFDIAEEAKEAMKQPQIHKAFETKISRERVGKEVSQIITGPDPPRGMLIMDEIGFFDLVFGLPSDLKPNSSSSPANIPVPVIVDKVLYANKYSELAKDMLPRYVPLVWWFATTYPYKDVLVEKKKGKYVPAVEIILKEGLKLSHSDAIGVVRVAEVLHGVEKASIQLRKGEHVSRKELGLIIRLCRELWPVAFECSLIDRLMVRRDEGDEVQKDVLSTYDKLKQLVFDYNLQDAYLMKPILNGDEIAESLGQGKKRGPWLGKAMDRLIQYQLEYPDIDATQAKSFLASLDFQELSKR